MRYHLLLITTACLALPQPAQCQGFYSREPLDVAAKRLPPHYYGVSELDLYNGSMGTQVFKGKYETSLHFKKRQQSARTKPIAGHIYTWSPVGLSCGSAWSDYNADSKRLNLHFVLYKGMGDNGQEALKLIRHEWTNREGSYIGQNGFGATTRVYTELKSAYGFVILNWNDFWFSQADGDRAYRVTCSLQANSAWARQLERRVNVLYVGYLTPPYRQDDYSSKTATFTSPVQSYKKYSLACIRLKQIWFYDSVTGFIYGKMGAKHSAPTPHTAPLKGTESAGDASQIRAGDDGEVNYLDYRDWQTVAPPGSGFSVAMPGAPQADTERHTWTISGVPYKYTVRFDTVPDDSMPGDMALQTAVEKLHQQLKVRASTEMQLQGHPGRDLLIDEQHSVTGRIRVILVGRRLYFVSVSHEESRAAVDRFMDSFTLLDAPEAVAPQRRHSVSFRPLVR